MKKAIYLSFFLFAAFFLVSPAFASSISYKNGDVISSDTVWEGWVRVNGVVLVPEGVTLTIKPGTTVLFEKSGSSYSEEGVSEVIIPGSGLRVEGKVIAAGEKGSGITFTSAEQSPAPGDWGCIFLDHSTGSVFKRCSFMFSAYTIHAHFSQFDLSRCTITMNEDGSRLGVCRVSFDHCDIMDNTGKGLNFRQCKNTVRYCNITRNQDGIFLNEKDAACVIEHNNIYGNTGMDLRLGEFHAEDVTLKGNYWGSTDAGEIKKRIYDRANDQAIGTALVEPAKEAVIGAGVDGLFARVLWKFKTGGFVDCSPAVSGGVVYFGSWDKNFYALKADTGELAWKYQTGDCVDSSPALSEGKVYFGSWDRNIYCLSASDGKLVWKFTMTPSNFDDHRQASPLILGKRLVMGGFNGLLYCLDKNIGGLFWASPMGGPIRSRAAVASQIPRTLVPLSQKDLDEFPGAVGSGDGRFYLFDFRTGAPFKTFETGGPVNSSPAQDGANVYFGSRDGNIHCLFEKGWEKVWSYQTGGRIEYSSPLVAGGILLIGDCNGVLHALDKYSGQPLWSFKGEGGIYSSPRLSDGKVVYSDNAGMVYWLVPESGKAVASFRAGDAVQGLSAAENGVVYAGSRDGHLYALTVGE